MIILAGKNKFFAALWSKNARYVEVKEQSIWQNPQTPSNIQFVKTLIS